MGGAESPILKDKGPWGSMNDEIFFFKCFNSFEF